MQILAGSLNVQMNSFLHSGYISAYPRTYKHEGGFHLVNSKVKWIDVKKAVELKPSKNQVAGTTTATALPPALQPASMESDAFVLAIAFLFFAYLIGLYYRKVRGVVKSGWKPWLFAAAAIIGIASSSRTKPSFSMEIRGGSSDHFITQSPAHPAVAIVDCITGYDLGFRGKLANEAMVASDPIAFSILAFAHPRAALGRTVFSGTAFRSSATGIHFPSGNAALQSVVCSSAFPVHGVADCGRTVADCLPFGFKDRYIGLCPAIAYFLECSVGNPWNP
jgi:hypothetical protein